MAKALVPPENRLVWVDRDNDGELYICREPLRWIRLPGSTGPLSEPVQMTYGEFLKRKARDR